MTENKRSLLTGLSLGRRVAEEEVDDLASYFVETEQWRKVLSDEVDIILGLKVQGKARFTRLYFSETTKCLIAECF